MSDVNEKLNDLGSLKVLVVGATGHQGGAVARKLLERGHHVLALTRNENSHKAKILLKLGAEIVKGDVGDVLSLQEVMKGVDAVFAMTTPFEKGVNFETKSGFLLEFAAITTSVKHFVFSSVASSHRNTRIPHFESKFKIEEHIKTKNESYTIIKPVYFMDNFLEKWMMSGLRKGKISVAMSSDRKLQMVSLEDLASFIVHVIENRDKFLRKTIEIASDEITGAEVAEVLSKVTGIPIEYQELSYKDIEPIGEDFVKTYKWFNDVGYDIEIENLHKKYPEIGWHSFQEWAKKQFWNLVNEPIKQNIM
ncbi:MAG: NmrA/HSCARG family protein [Promethearchaeota archaeon]